MGKIREVRKTKTKQSREKSEDVWYRIYPITDNYRYAFDKLYRLVGGWSLAACLGYVVLSIMLPFLAMALPSIVVALLTGGKSPGIILVQIALLVGVLEAIRFFQNILRNWWYKAAFDLRLALAPDYYRACMKMDLKLFEGEKGQKILASANQNIFYGDDTGIQANLVFFSEALINLGTLAVYGTIIAYIAPVLLLFLIIQTALTVAAHMWAGRRGDRLRKESQAYWRSFYYLRRESILAQNGKDIRMYHMEGWLMRALNGAVDRIVKKENQDRQGIVTAQIFEQLFTFGRDLVVYGYLVSLMASDRISLAAFLLYVGAVAGFGSWMSGLLDALQRMIRNNMLMNYFRSFFELCEGKDISVPVKKAVGDFYGNKSRQKLSDEQPKVMGTPHEIRLEKVGFSYDGEREVLKNVNLTIRSGEKLALVGLNGAGKTTLVKLLCGLYQPTEGRILLDGQDMSVFSRESILEAFSVVFQDAVPFSFSLADNVTCAPAEREDEALLCDCFKRAGLWERVSRMPRGIRTMVNKDLDPEGVALSGGETQKLMLARALYKNAPILILDEPTAALDPIAESEMYEHYREMMGEKTALFISHRLSSTRFCDRILFLEKGRIIEEGNHEELMEKQGAYAALFALQARYYQKEGRNDRQ